jgi:hypothetical protein
VNQARLANYEDSSASAFVAEGKSAKEASEEAKPSSDSDKADKADKSDESDAVAGKPSRAKSSSKLSSASRHAAAPKAKPAAHAAVEPRETKEAKEPAKEVAREVAKPAKADTQGPASSAVNEAAAVALGNSAKLASSCRPRGGPSGEGKARVIYSNEGEVQSVEILTAKFRDTLTGSCVKMVFRRAKIAPFKGEPPTFIKSFTIPEE